MRNRCQPWFSLILFPPRDFFTEYSSLEEISFSLWVFLFWVFVSYLFVCFNFCFTIIHPSVGLYFCLFIFWVLFLLLGPIMIFEFESSCLSSILNTSLPLTLAIFFLPYVLYFLFLEYLLLFLHSIFFNTLTFLIRFHLDEEFEKQNKQTKPKESYRYREQIEMREGLGGWVKKDERD